MLSYFYWLKKNKLISILIKIIQCKNSTILDHHKIESKKINRIIKSYEGQLQSDEIIMAGIAKKWICISYDF